MDAMSMPPPLAEIYRWGILHGEKTYGILVLADIEATNR